MIWKRIPKELTPQPKSGTYKDWKRILADEGFRQCAYCAIQEASFGGSRNYHVEHYRPQSRFPHLANRIDNLFYSCAICNSFKGDDWPNEPSPEHSAIAYPKPSDVDYREIFEVDGSIGVVKGTTVASVYVAERLYLNRPQLVIERRAHDAFGRLGAFVLFLRNALPRLSEMAQAGDADAIRLLAKICTQLIDLDQLKDQYASLRPYEPQDIKRTA